MESKAPRTDAEFKLEAFFDGVGIVETVLVEFARQLETELADKDRQLAEARAEIERLKQLWSCNLDIIGGELNKQLVEARARLAVLERAHDSTIEEQAALCSEGQSITELVAAKDGLVEQMREALKAIDGIGREAGNARREDALRCFAIAAAAMAAEGGE